MKPRSVCIISAVYPPEPLVSGYMARDLADHLADHDTRVTVMCPQPSRPPSANYEHLKKRKTPLLRTEDKVDVVRLPSFSAPKSGILRRARESFSFGRYVCGYLKNDAEKPDALYVNAWPLFSQALIMRYARLHRIPVVLQIMDVYPESLTLKLPKGIRFGLTSLLTHLDRWIAQQAAAIIVISENMRRQYIEKRRIKSSKIVTVNLWQDEALFTPLPPRQDACHFYAVPEDKLTFLYLGNIGPVAGVELVIQAFHGAQIQEAQLIVAGDGSSKASCYNLAKSLGGANIRFLSDPDFRNTALILGMAHVCLLPILRGAGLSSVPSKLMAYLLSAKPILATVDRESDAARIIKEAGCGWQGEAGELSWLANKMREVAGLPHGELERIGEKGRQFYLREFSRATGLQKLSDRIMAP
ncbi:MAG: glycosyltransferase family 4 protein [Candidatus Aminicenantes bacterium]|nr:glycosyltransferase family 4 protein [Candidatus Aminicenantes bacterium]